MIEWRTMPYCQCWSNIHIPIYIAHGSWVVGQHFEFCLRQQILSWTVTQKILVVPPPQFLRHAMPRTDSQACCYTAILSCQIMTRIRWAQCPYCGVYGQEVEPQQVSVAKRSYAEIWLGSLSASFLIWRLGAMLLMSNFQHFKNKHWYFFYIREGNITESRKRVLCIMQWDADR